MCRQESGGVARIMSAEEEIAAEESLSIYCKPVEFYNILQRRAIRNVTTSLMLVTSYFTSLFSCRFFSADFRRFLVLFVALVSSKMFALQNWRQAQKEVSF